MWLCIRWIILSSESIGLAVVAARAVSNGELEACKKQWPAGLARIKSVGFF